MSIEKVLFGKLANGKDVYEYILTNANGAKLQVLSYGLRIHKLLVPNKNGTLTDVVLGYDKLEQYLGADFQGATIGRYANRIAGAQFTVDNQIYKLTANNGHNSLHGGPNGYHQVCWKFENACDSENPSVTFSYLSPDMEEGFPGNLKITVCYSLSSENEVKITYTGLSDKKTPYNPTNHSFFNLNGNHSENILDTWLQINAENYTPVNDELIPTGDIFSVKDTPLDFTEGKLLGKDMFSDDHLISLCGGFDHNFCVNGIGLRHHAKAYCEKTGIVLDVYSDMPGVQLFTFNHTAKIIGKNGQEMVDHGAFCLETQFYPDSVNQPSFPFNLLEPNKDFTTETIYKFSVK